MEHARSLDFGLLLNSVQHGIVAIDLTGAIVPVVRAGHRVVLQAVVRKNSIRYAFRADKLPIYRSKRRHWSETCLEWGSSRSHATCCGVISARSGYDQVRDGQSRLRKIGQAFK